MLNLNLSFIDLGRRRNKFNSLYPLIKMYRNNCFAKIEILNGKIKMQFFENNVDSIKNCLYITNIILILAFIRLLEMKLQKLGIVLLGAK